LQRRTSKEERRGDSTEGGQRGAARVAGLGYKETPIERSSSSLM
jgi:hypothetical protein